MVSSADDAGVDPQYGLEYICGVPVLHGVPRGWYGGQLTKDVDGNPKPDEPYCPDYAESASTEALLGPDLHCEIQRRNNLEAHCVKLEAQLQDKSKRTAIPISFKETNESSQSLGLPADQSGGTSQKTADDGTAEQAVDGSSRQNELEPEQTSQNESGGMSQESTVNVNENTARQAVSANQIRELWLENTVERLKKRLREAEGNTRNAEEETREAQEEARTAKKLRLEEDHKLTVEKKNMTTLKGLAQTLEPKLRSYLHGQPVIDPCSGEEWALFGWLEQALKNVSDWYVHGGAASLVEDDLKSHFPFNGNPNPEPEPTPYDLRIGPVILTNVLSSGESLPSWREKMSDTLHKILNTKAITKGFNGKFAIFAVATIGSVPVLFLMPFCTAPCNGQMENFTSH